MYEEIANELKEKYPVGAFGNFTAILFLKECFTAGFAFGMVLTGNWVYFGYIECAIARDFFPGFTQDEYYLEMNYEVS